MALTKTTSLYKFGRGLAANYDSSDLDLIWFATDEHAIYMGGVKYDLNLTDTLNALDIQTVADGDKVLAADASGVLSSTISLGYADKKITLAGISGTVISEINADDFIKDGMLESAKVITVSKVGEGDEAKFMFIDGENSVEATGVSEEGKYIHLKFNTDADKADVFLSIGEMSAEIATLASQNAQDIVALSGTVDSLSGAVATAVETLSGNIETVADNLSGVAADLDTLSGVVDGLVKDTTLADDLSGEIARAEGVEGELSGAIAAVADDLSGEIARAEGVEGELSGSISTVATNLDTLSGIVNDIATDTTLSDDLSGEIARAEGVENELSGSISTVATDLDTLSGVVDGLVKDTTLADDLSGEIARAEGVEGELSGAIAAVADDLSGEIARAEGVEGELSGSISTVATNLDTLSGIVNDIATDTTLADDLSGEIVRAEGVEGELSGSIDTLSGIVAQLLCWYEYTGE